MICKKRIFPGSFRCDRHPRIWRLRPWRRRSRGGSSRCTCRSRKLRRVELSGSWRRRWSAADRSERMEAAVWRVLCRSAERVLCFRSFSIWRRSTIEPKPPCRVGSKTEKTKSRSSGIRFADFALFNGMNGEPLTLFSVSTLQLTNKTLSSSSQTELENRLHQLTETLIQKQTMLEALGTEKSSLVFQLERLEQQLKSSQGGPSGGPAINMSGLEGPGTQDVTLLHVKLTCASRALMFLWRQEPDRGTPRCCSATTTLQEFMEKFARQPAPSTASGKPLPRHRCVLLRWNHDDQKLPFSQHKTGNLPEALPRGQNVCYSLHGELLLKNWDVWTIWFETDETFSLSGGSAPVGHDCPSDVHAWNARPPRRQIEDLNVTL